MTDKSSDGGSPKRGKPNTAPGTGRVRLVKRGRLWYARFRAEGRREDVPLKLTNKESAERKAAEINDALEKREPWEWTVGRAPAGDRIFTAVVDEWLEKGCRWSENTRRGHRSIISQVKAEFGRRSVAEIRSQDLEGYLARRKAEGMPAASRNRILATLKVIFKTAASWGYVPNNPAATVKMEREEVRTKDVLDDGEFERLLVELSEDSRRVVLTAADTGMRRAELERIAWEDVDLVAGELRIAQAKNGESRIVPLTRRLRSLLGEMRCSVTAHPKAPVFEAVVDNRVLASALHRARIDKHITLHSFRHQFATRALEADVSSFHLQAIGGWKSPAMLQRYGKVRNKALHEQMAKLNA